MKTVHKSREVIVSRLDALLPHKIRTLLSELGELAEQEKIKIYLVGGFVRDLLMNHRNLDIDLVVEGDGVAFAHQIVKGLGGRLTYHKKFATAVVTLPDDFHIDVASARTEVYERPAALPQVEPGTLKQDLFRRDFTINAMAIALNISNFGELLDYFGGEKDIETRQITVLHKQSFIDDPTRLFRAARFEQRYGFKMSYQTEKLARAAVKKGLLSELTQVRIHDELILILSEAAPWRVLKRLDDLGVLKSLQPKLGMGSREERLFREVDNTLHKLRGEFKEPLKRYLVYLSALVERLPPRDVAQFLAFIRVRATDRRAVVQAVKETPRILRILKKDVANSRLYRLLAGLPREVVAFVYAQGGPQERDKIRHYFTLRETKLEISGNDFIRLGYKPSEDFKKVLDRVLDAKLNGKVAMKKEELVLAQQVFDKLKRKKG